MDSLPHFEEQEASKLPEREHVTNLEPPEFDIIRARVYRLLGVLLANPPQNELINTIKTIDLPENQLAIPMTTAWRALRDASVDTTIVESLKLEFHNLFIGVGRGELVPYASWYLSGLLLSKPLAALRKSLSDLGMQRKDGINEPEDHIAALCEVMSMLILEGGENSFADQEHFFSQYMKSWASEFFNDLQQAPSAQFYKAVGKLGSVFIDVEKQYFSITA